MSSAFFKKGVVELESKYKIRALAGVLVIFIASSIALCVKNFKLESEIESKSNLIELEKYVNDNYYKAADKESAMNGALKGYVEGLEDPYSSYLTADEYNSWKTMESGTMVGIGVTVQFDEESGLYVAEVKEGYPAYESGIKEGDIITEVEGESIPEMGYEEAVSRIKGEEGTSVNLTIKRDDNEDMKFSVLRSEIVVNTVSGKMLDEDIAYIRISAFRENTDEQFKEIFDELIDDGAKGLVFDLRNNGGGMLVSLKAILDPLLPEGTIATAKYGNGEVKTIIESDKNEINLPMAVLVNGNTASAAELFAASLSDFDKAFLVGETTYGKGVMQDTREVAGGAVTLTVATYQTVRGECYHGIGITPDYEVSLSEDFVLDYENPDEKGDSQLKTAIENLKK